jgi:hypothetical protein
MLRHHEAGMHLRGAGYASMAALLFGLWVVLAKLVGVGMPVVSDNGVVFTSAAYQGLLEVLSIAVCHMEKGKP